VAKQHKVTLCIEYLNRFECYFLTTATQAVELVKSVNHPNFKTMFDTFHAHIEEKSQAATVRTLAPVLAHVHISENDRGTPGQGDVKWCETFEALHQISYNDQLVVEAFGLALPEIAAATKIWRRMYESEEQLSRDALAFMKANVAKRWKC